MGRLGSQQAHGTWLLPPPHLSQSVGYRYVPPQLSCVRVLGSDLRFSCSHREQLDYLPSPRSPVPLHLNIMLVFGNAGHGTPELYAHT